MIDANEVLTRIWENMAGRVTGPMKFRLVLQPSMALFLAIRSGLKDAREGKPAYFWALFTGAEERRLMLQDGWKSEGRLLILAVVLDAIYQFIALRRFYPGEAVLVAFFLAIVPYLLVRGPVNRIARRMHNAAKERKAVV
jgi:hypothetical protein